LVYGSQTLLNIYIKIIFFSLWSSFVLALAEDRDFVKAKRRYFSELTRFQKQVCPKGTEENYQKMLQNYRGLGFYLPELNGDVDLITIEKLLPEMEKKLKWIKVIISKLEKDSKWPKPEMIDLSILELINQLLSLKYDFTLAQTEKQKNTIADLSLKKMKELKKSYHRLVDQVYFLNSYDFPVDHLKNRKVYDDFKDFQDSTSKQISNYAFFYRKILEDGTLNADRTGSDLFLRSTLDTIWFEFERIQPLIDEDLRNDLEWSLKKIKKEVTKGKDHWLERFVDWQQRLISQISFYKDLIHPDNRAHTQEIIKNQNQALIQLKEFVLSKQEESYVFWSKLPSEIQALFVLDTILYSEVGDVDAPYGLERIDVSQIVWNRFHHPVYSELNKVQDLFIRLNKKIGEDKIKEAKWLNILFRLGEFSFTYPYIPGVVKIFCGDQTPKGKKLQSENLFISWTTLKSPRSDFTPIRYFSRAAMFGRINMGLVWDKFKLYPERPGLLAPGQTDLIKDLLLKNFRFLYSFKDPLGVEFWTIEVKNKVFVVKPEHEKSLFYLYRNPQDFRYFSIIE